MEPDTRPWFEPTTSKPNPNRGTKESGIYSNHSIMTVANKLMISIFSPSIDNSFNESRNPGLALTHEEAERRVKFLIKVINLHLEESKNFEKMSAYVSYLQRR